MGFGFGVVLALMVSLALCVLYNLNNIDTQFSFVIKHDAPAIANARQLSKLVVDMETGQRGFVITGNDEFLEPYNQALIEFESLLETEKQLVSDNPPQVRLLERISDSIQEWNSLAATPEIAMRRRISERGLDERHLEEVLSKGIGKNILDQIRSLADRMESSFAANGSMSGPMLIGRIQKSMVDQETGERGFLITGKEEFLEPFDSGQVELSSALAALRTLVADAHDRDATKFDLKHLATLHQRWTTEDANVEGVTRQQSQDGQAKEPELDMVRSPEPATSTLDEIRALIIDLENRFGISQAFELRRLTYQLSIALEEQNFGQHQFLVSGNGRQLEPLHGGGEKFKITLETLQKLSSKTYDIQEMTKDIDLLELLAADWLAEAAVPEIAARRLLDSHPETLADVAMMLEQGEGKRILDRIRTQFASFIEEEERLTSRRFATASNSSSNTFMMTVLVASFSLVLGVILAFVIARGISIPARQLVDAIETVAEGDRDQVIEVNSTDEMGRLSVAFNRMVGDLRQLDSERDQIASEIQDAKEFTENIVSSMADMLLVFSPSGSIVAVNEAACKILGYAEAELIDRPARFVLCPMNDDELQDEDIDADSSSGISNLNLPLSQEALRCIGEDGSVNRIEQWFRTQDGNRIATELSGSLMRDRCGAINGVVCVVQDISQRKEDERLLFEMREEADERARELESQKYALDQHAIVAITNPAGKMTHVNDNFVALSQFSRAELIGQDHRIVNSGHHPRSFFVEMWKTISSGRVWKGDVCNRAKDGSFYWVYTTIVPFKNVDGKITQHVVIRADITERRMAELAMKESKAAADSANQAKSEFLANMSHEIRTPMTAILGFAENMLEIDQCESERLNCVHTIRRNGEYLISIINDILDLSKIEAGKMEIEIAPCNVCQVVAEVASLMRVRADERNIALNIEFAGPIPEIICCDSTRLRQILINLIGNAIKFTDVGAVRLIARFIESPSDGRPGLTGPQMRFDVVDTGIGLTEEQASNLFQPFMQADSSTSRKFGGTGLGLTISRRFAEMLGGGLELISAEIGVGSQFRATITTGSLDNVRMLEDPMFAMNLVDSSTRLSAINATDLIDLNILLAEDGSDNQRLISFILKKAGAVVTTVENGKLALDAALAAEESGPAFDVVLMDMQMPVMGGYEATECLRHKGYTKPIVALTAHAMEGDRQRCINSGCDDYATKPIDRKALIETIRNVVEKNRESSSDLAA